MKRLTCLLILSGSLSGPSISAAHAAEPPLPIRVILVGDSTMATRSGYGDALCARFKPGTSCVNLARGGRSSGSFRAEGRWDEVQNLLRDSAAYRASYVLVQFGHNDQPGKPGRSTDLVTDFPANMARYAGEVKQLGGIPVLVTPLTRRSFKGAYLKDDLAPWSSATRKVAQEQKVALLDLNGLSADAVQQMGQQEADTLAMAPPPQEPAPAPAGTEPQGTPKSAFDRTHVGPKGAALFSGMVARALVRLVPSIAASLD
ncbi:MAG: hydrolase [Massilia sp.]|jgi:lysophospholipase L1-like esterase|nr:hydrolase [Massilia sp.]